MDETLSSAVYSPVFAYEQSPTVGDLAKALAAAQGKIANPKADSANPFFKSFYADLAGVIEAVKEPLASQGIARHQAVLSRDTEVGPEVGVRTALIHSSGQWLAATVWCRPEKPGPQALGSVITYLRRYSLAAAVGVAQVDDDAESAEKRGPREAVAATPAKALPQATQARIKILQKECGIEEREWREKLKQHYGVDSSTKLSPEAVEDLIAKLEARRALGGTTPPGASQASKSS